ncbi:hypothetical protein [Streptomyces sporangiiformans]|uniref:DUF1579 domain-containing protein n=1 Tax=Streptomyces sporangiiformans TaxID=2315329 RepID=A0A505D681_9ACTN|nr:hypothetical protein [Streptomyces sporangiiformans]TPQ16278.1 hypothetical protein FGD71_042515 [Streptomyces sporangiiformans]
MSTPHDFDFFIGEWDVTHRRRTDFLDAQSTWEEFPATNRCWSLFDGAANIDEMDVPSQGWKGLTLRLFDQETEQWSLNWSSSRSGRLFPPVIGHFTDGRGEFFGDDTLPNSRLRSSGGTPIGQPVRVRFVWSGISDTTARWEQAFSVDGEKTWVTNWFMDFTRRAAPVSGTTSA